MDKKKQEFFEQYAPLAMEQQQKYGIPASVTLAQAWWERGAANEVNNCFGIKADSSWLRAGKPYAEYKDDDTGLSKFRQYGSVAESYEDHSRFLLSNPRYRSAYGCKSDDYHGWLEGLRQGGYSTNPAYVKNLEDDIRSYGLYKYDSQALREAKNEIGYLRGSASSFVAAGGQRQVPFVRGSWALPVATDGDLLLTSDYGLRARPVAGASRDHKGIDIGVPSGTRLVATEDGGTVTRTDWNTGHNGHCVEVTYQRGGDTYVTQYLHLSRVDVREGQKVDANSPLGLSGSSGVGTGAHLDFRVMKNGQYIDPKDYLAEVSARGSLTQALVRSGESKDLLASRKPVVGSSDDAALAALSGEQKKNADQGSLASLVGSGNPLSILSYLMGQNGDGAGLQQGGITGIISSLFMSAISMAAMIDAVSNHSSSTVSDLHAETEEEQKDNVVRRDRESIDPERYRNEASIYFSRESPEKSEKIGMSLG